MEENKKTPAAPSEAPEAVPKTPAEVIHEKLKAIAAAVKQNQQSAAPALSLNLVKDLFECVPDLESIQKDARQRVANQLLVKEMHAGDILVREEDDIKEFYIVADGLLQMVPKGQKVDIKVRSFLWVPPIKNIE